MASFHRRDGLVLASICRVEILGPGAGILRERASGTARLDEFGGHPLGVEREVGDNRDQFVTFFLALERSAAAGDVISGNRCHFQWFQRTFATPLAFPESNNRPNQWLFTVDGRSAGFRSLPVTLMRMATAHQVPCWMNGTLANSRRSAPRGSSSRRLVGVEHHRCAAWQRVGLPARQFRVVRITGARERQQRLLHGGRHLARLRRRRPVSEPCAVSVPNISGMSSVWNAPHLPPSCGEPQSSW